MSISRRPNREAQPGPGRRALEALALALALAFLPELARARYGAVLEPHPGWIAVLVLAARYGSGGFFTGLIAAAGAAGIGSAVAGAGLLTPWSHLDSGRNLVAFGACLTVSWVAARHLRREAELGERLRALSVRATRADASIEGLRALVTSLRARVDRTSTSLSFLRDVAGRLEGTDPVAAADAAAELALARTGASATAVEVGRGGFQWRLAARDARGPKALAPLSLLDADLTVPIRNRHDPVGIIALWGIPPSGLDQAAAHDLAVIASWCMPAVSVAAWHPEAAAVRAPEVP